MKKLGLILLLAIGLGATGVAIAPGFLGGAAQLGKPAALTTCDALRVGTFVQQLGASSEGRTKICFCGSDGAASPAYAWCSLAITQAAAMVCTGGTTTVCP